MLTLREGEQAIRYCRLIIDCHLNKKPLASSSLPKIFLQKAGVFVTLHTYPTQQLRGCIGLPYPIMPLENAIKEAAESVTHDPRFSPLKIEEIDKVIIEVTILSPPIKIIVKNPQQYLDKIEIGRDGLIAEQGYYKGLLLPQVPVEQGWTVEEFLTQTCLKAGLLPDAWFNTETILYRFSGQIFYEVSPKGEIREKKIDGSNN
jgi:uncharacterized protein (TIGR00296 family)